MTLVNTYPEDVDWGADSSVVEPVRVLGRDRSPGGRSAPHEDRPRPKPRWRLSMDRHQVRAVIEGRKNKHARLVKMLPDGSTPDPADAGQLLAVDDRVPVCKVGGPTVCHVAVTDIIQRKLGDMDLTEARAHGFRTTVDYARAFMGATDPLWRRLTADELADKTDDQVTERWEASWAWRPAWVLSFVYDPLENQRWMKAGAIKQVTGAEDSDAARGYTRSPALAVRGEGPAPDNAFLEVKTQEARARDQARREGETAEKLKGRTAAEADIIARFAQTLALAHAKGIDTRSHSRLVGLALKGLEADILAQIKAHGGAS